MNVSELMPQPLRREAFKRSRECFIPAMPGCYALTPFSGVVLYIGQTANLRRRMNEHLDSPEKVGVTRLGRAALFHWLECSATSMIERTWMNVHFQHEGVLPELNRIYAPVSV
ncbi:GIY-YIG nuclease family protein [Leptospira interrogans]